MHTLTKKIVIDLARKYNINLNVMPISLLKKAILIETEHFDTVGPSYDLCTSIVCDHLREFGSMYYKYLIEMEKQLTSYIHRHPQPSPFLGN